MASDQFERLQSEIPTLSDDALIEEVYVHKDRYSEAQIILFEMELSKRMLSFEYIVQRKTELRAKFKEETRKYIGIRGWLLVYLLRTITVTTISFFLIFFLFSQSMPVLGILYLFCFIVSAVLTVMILQKRKIVINVLKVFCIMGVLGMAMILAGIAVSYLTGRLYRFNQIYILTLSITLLVSAIIQVLWFIYFTKSKRVKYTMIR